MRLGSIRRALASIEVGCERNISLSGKAIGLIADPVVHPPIFLNDDDGGMLSLRCRNGEVALALARRRRELHGGAASCLGGGSAGNCGATDRRHGGGAAAPT